jgi:hypothetical protein
MFASRIYFSFTEITDPAKHRDHNEWHSLDHRPENMVLEGVALGDRWVRSPDCAAASTVLLPEYANVHYAIMYWFREPLEQTLNEWFDLSERSFQWGRSPQIGWTRRPLRSFFTPIRGYVAPRVRVTAEALPFRPMRGVFVTISRIHGTKAAASEVFRWYDEVHMPDLLSCHGVAGAWTFASAGSGSSTWSFADARTRAVEDVSLRLHLLFMDEDPLEFVADYAGHKLHWQDSGRLRDTSHVEEQVFAGPLRNIVPWQWDWFETTNSN